MSLHPARRRAACALLVLAAVLGVQGGWIHAKAILAQLLLREAWADAQTGAQAPRPWPWADTHPVARLRMDRLEIDQIVLAGDDGRTLAFGPGWAPASAAPGQGGHLVISGHRDTHFAWLQALRAGDVVQVDHPGGSRAYRIRATEVVDSRRDALDIGADASGLSLVTCWPFDAVHAGGPMRYVVSAEPVARDVGS